MSTQLSINDIANLRAIPAAIPANPGSIAIENITGTGLVQVDDQGNVSPIGSGSGGAIDVTPNTGLDGDGSSGDPLTGLAASGSINGYLSAANWTKLNAIPEIRRKRVTVGVDVAAPATTIPITAISGDADGDYDFYVYLAYATAAVFNRVVLQPNADSGNASCEALWGISNAASAANESGLSMCVVNTTAAGNTAQIEGFFRVRQGTIRGYFARAIYYENTTRNLQITGGRYTVFNTDVTSLVVSSNQATSLLTGSYGEVISRGIIT